MLVFTAHARQASFRLAGLALALGLFVGLKASAQTTSTTGLVTRAVGGISIDAQGALRNASVDETGQLQRFRTERFQPIPAELNQAVALRKISLRGLEAALARYIQSGQPMPDTLRYLASSRSNTSCSTRSTTT